MADSSQKTRVVVADDQNISRGFFEMYVRAASDYELVAGLRTAQEAMDFIDKNPVDLLILDIVVELQVVPMVRHIRIVM